MRPVIVLTAILSCAAVPALAQRATDISGLCGTSSPATWQGLLGDVVIRVGAEADEARLTRAIRAARAAAS